MRFLIDTNIFLEVLLAQERAAEAQAFLAKAEERASCISDYSLHSIGLLHNYSVGTSTMCSSAS